MNRTRYLLLIGLVTVGSSVGCARAKHCLHRLEKVGRNSCDCEMQQMMASSAEPIYVSDVDQPIPEELAEETKKLKQQLYDFEKDLNIAIEEAKRATDQNRELKGQLAKVLEERDRWRSEYRMAQANLDRKKEDLERIRQQFQQSQAENERLITNLERRLQKLATICDFDREHDSSSTQIR